MKSALMTMVLILVLSMLVVPGFAQESNGPDGVPLQLEGIITGREGFSIYSDETLNAKFSGTDLAKPEGMPLAVWRSIYSRDGFGVYDAETQRARASVSMPEQVWRVITSRDGFNIYATENLAADTFAKGFARPEGMPAYLWQIITGREGFSVDSTCLAC
jgi:hypothetical protein